MPCYLPCSCVSSWPLPYKTPRIVIEPSNQAHAERPVLRVVSFNDLDGTLLSDDGRAVAAELKASLDASRAECGCPTLAVAAGGQLSGTLVADLGYGRAVIDAMNLFDLDAAMLGPRDLAWPRDTVKHRTTEATFPWVVTNVFDRAAGARPVWMRSSVVVEIAGRSVAILGYLSPVMAARARSDDMGTLDVRPAVDGLGRMVERARERGADIVILLAQAGSACTARGCDKELFDLAHEVSGLVDVIIAGGDGLVIDTVVAGVPVVQALGQGRGWAVADLLESGSQMTWHTKVAQLDRRWRGRLGRGVSGGTACRGGGIRRRARRGAGAVAHAQEAGAFLAQPVGG